MGVVGEISFVEGVIALVGGMATLVIVVSPVIISVCGWVVTVIIGVISLGLGASSTVKDAGEISCLDEMISAILFFLTSVSSSSFDASASIASTPGSWSCCRILFARREIDVDRTSKFSATVLKLADLAPSKTGATAGGSFVEGGKLSGGPGGVRLGVGTGDNQKMDRFSL